MTKKEVKINYSYVTGDFLVQLYDEGSLYEWHVVGRTDDMKKLIQEFYFKDDVRV